MASGRGDMARRTGVVPGGKGRFYREVWPAKSRVAVVLPAPNRLTMSYTYIHIYQEEAEERRKPHPKMGYRRPPPSPSMGARCLLGGRSARLDGPVQGQRFGGEEKEDLSKLLYIFGLEAEGFPTQKREACEACAEIEF